MLLQLTRFFTWIFCRLYFRISFHGVENVPGEGPVILAPNHVSFLDPIWVSVPIRRPIRYMTWDRFVRMPVLGFLIRTYGGFPVKLESGDRTALRESARQLRAGGPLMIFPEGGRTRSGRIMPFKPGFIRLALETKAPIVPVTIVGGYAAFAPHHRFPRPRRVTVIYHPPLYLSGPAVVEDMKDYLHQQSALVQQIVAASAPAEQTVSQLQMER
ncbi:MAG: lysophospholipid acyltransferase family protein [Blastocatellia bacterium]